MFSSARVCYTLFITISTRKGGRGLNQTSRILEEVKKAVCGKDRVLVWVLTVLLARGHVLLEDIPGRRQDDHGAGVFPRAGARLRARAVYAGRAAVRYHRLFRLSEGERQAASISPVRCSAICSSRMSSTGRRPARSLRCWRPWRRGRSPLTASAIRSRSRSSSLPRRTRRALPVRSCCRTRRWTVLPSGCPSAIRQPADECSMVLARQGVNPLQTVEQVLSRAGARCHAGRSRRGLHQKRAGRLHRRPDRRDARPSD